MPNVDKIVKNVMHEISDGKTAVRETMTTALRNQDIMIVQNKQIISLLEQITSQLAALPITASQTALTLPCPSESA